MRVLVTRPKPDAVRTAARLEAAGHEPILLSLAEVRALPVFRPSWEGFDAVVLTSANAARLAPQARLARIAHLPCLVVGDSTAAAARSAGLTRIETAAGDAESLAELAIERTAPGANILYLCGRVRRPAFEDLLAAAGRRVMAVEVYDTLRRDAEMDEVRTALGGRSVDAALVYSPLSGEALVRLSNTESLRPLFAATRFLCISERAAAPFAGRNLDVAERPDEDALFALLRQPG